MEIHCVNMELKYQNQALKDGQHGQILNETINKAKINKEIEVLEKINIELEHSVAKLLADNEKLHKENEHLKQTYKDLYDSIKTIRVQTKDQNAHDCSKKYKTVENADLKLRFKISFMRINEGFQEFMYDEQGQWLLINSDQHSCFMIMASVDNTSDPVPQRKERFNTTAGNPVKKILLKLNLSDHRLFKDGGGATRLRLVDDLKMLKITMSNTSSRNKLNPEINDHYNIFTGECQKDELKTKDKALYARLKDL
ncbi:hypothetical protein Tco_1103580 [Tanacetum coccineum]